LVPWPRTEGFQMKPKVTIEVKVNAALCLLEAVSKGVE
jgi:hypothetical protein